MGMTEASEQPNLQLELTWPLRSCIITLRPMDNKTSGVPMKVIEMFMAL